LAFSPTPHTISIYLEVEFNPHQIGQKILPKRDKPAIELRYAEY
jgi:hypothetical protein